LVVNAISGLKSHKHRQTHMTLETTFIWNMYMVGMWNTLQPPGIQVSKYLECALVDQNNLRALG